MQQDQQEEYPSVLGVLGYLAAAGRNGLVAGEITLMFTERVSRLRTHVEVNTILGHQRELGHVRRSPGLEPTPLYHGVPCWRWYITAQGRQYLASGGRPGSVQRRAALRRQREQWREEDHRSRAELLEEARARAALLVPGDLPARNELVRELRGRGLYLQELGTIMGLTRERIRQITSKSLRVLTRQL